MQLQYNGQNGDSAAPKPDSLDMYSDILSPSDATPILERTNLGQGNYDERYLWQQIRSFRKGLYAYVAFSRTLTQRAIHETKIKLAREGFSHYNEQRDDVEQWDALEEDDVDDETSIWNAELERGQEIWAKLGNSHTPISEKQAAALLEKTGIDEEWLPIYWQMVSGRHEASRSKDAELLRDFLTGIKHLRSEGDAGEVAKVLGGSD